jgi:hypothetical protein
MKTLMMDAETFFETLEYNSMLKLLIALEGFVATSFNVFCRPRLGTGEKIN